MKARQYNILVTGVGAIIGYGIIKSLKLSDYSLNIIGTDIYADAVGKAWSDKFIKGELASSDAFPHFIEKVVQEYNINLIIPGIEQDIDALSEMVHKKGFNQCKVVLNSNESLFNFRRKYLTYRMLEQLELPFLPYFTSNAGFVNKQLINKLQLPCIAKKDISYSRKGQVIIKNEEQLNFYSKLKDYIFQKYIDSGTEYTISVFGLGDGSYCNPIAMQRLLGPDGATHKAIIVPFSIFELQVELIVRAMKPVGPTNFQFIQPTEKDEIFLLEVNPRISSSSSLRAKFGINEPEMCIEYFLENRIPLQRIVRSGKAQRYIDEVVEYDMKAIENDRREEIGSC